MYNVYFIFLKYYFTYEKHNSVAEEILYHLLAGDQLRSLPPPPGCGRPHRNEKRMNLKASLVLTAVLIAAPAHAGTSSATDTAKNEPSLRLTFLQETIGTSNALDGPKAVSDTIQHLRGALEDERQTDIGRFGLTASLEVFEYRDIGLESDRYADVALTYARAFGDRFALRGTFGYAWKDEGDDIAIGPFLVGIRTASQIASAGLEAILRLAPATIANASLTSDYEAVGNSRFTVALPDLRLSPDRRTITLAAGLRHRRGGTVFSLKGQGTRVTLPGNRPAYGAIASERFRLTAGVEMAGPEGLDLAAEFGLAYLRDDFGLSDRAYPVYGLHAGKTFKDGLTAKISLRGYVDTLDTDDPLASHIRRAEAEISRPLLPYVTASAGLFSEWRDNIALGNEEKATGAYIALAYSPVERHDFLLRVDYDERHRTAFDIDEETVKGTLGLRVRL